MSLKVSVITTTFNSAQTLRATLNSVAAQEYPNIEHIIVDGGSTDGTCSILEDFPHIALVSSERDNGVYDAMNRGLKKCTGDIVCFLNSDDWYTRKDVISMVVNVYEETGTDVIYGDLQYVVRKNPEKVVRTWRSGCYNRINLFFGWMPPHPTFFAKKQVYDKVGFFNTKLSSAADYELMLRILLRLEMTATYLPFVLVKMRMGGLSNKSLIHRFRANREDFTALRMNGIQLAWLTRYLKPLRKIPQFFMRG